MYWSKQFDENRFLTVQTKVLRPQLVNPTEKMTNFGMKEDNFLIYKY